MELAPKPFGTRLRELRERACLSQASLAEGANAHVTALSHWEDGRRIPDPIRLEAMIRRLKTTSKPDELWDLVESAAVTDHRYLGLLAIVKSTIPAVDTRLEAFEAWAKTFPSRGEKAERVVETTGTTSS